MKIDFTTCFTLLIVYIKWYNQFIIGDNMKIKSVLKEKNIQSGYLYFYIHFITELVCFYLLHKIHGDSYLLWILPLLYDMLAFVPQSIIGYYSDKHPNVNLGLIGIIALTISLPIYFILKLPYLAIIVLCLGNALIHVNGAEVTLRSSNGKLASPAIFVGGGSFGVVTGKLLASTHVSYLLIILFSLTMIPFVLLAEYYKKDTLKDKNPCKNFNYHNKKMNIKLLIFLAVFIVIVRAYMGYGIPTSWNKTTLETILLFSFMGVGKCLGGIMCDLIGMRKTAIISIVCSLPFLLCGDNIMIVSLFGIMLFSMTMAITLGILVSALKKTPGLAFGLTTIGLFLGTAPIFFVKLHSFESSCLLITSLTIVCLLIVLRIIPKEAENVRFKI